MGILTDTFCRALGFGEDLPEPLIEAECRREIAQVLTITFPPLSRIEKERQAIANKRTRFTEDLSVVRAERARIKAEIVDLDADEADIVRILAGLDKNEAEIDPVEAAELEIEAEARRISKRSRKPVLAAAE